MSCSPFIVTRIRFTRSRKYESDQGVAGTGKGATARQRLFGGRVRARREELGLTQEALAYRAGINRTYIGSLESGQRNPSLDTIARLARALGIDAAELVRGVQSRAGRAGS